MGLRSSSAATTSSEHDTTETRSLPAPENQLPARGLHIFAGHPDRRAGDRRRVSRRKGARRRGLSAAHPRIPQNRDRPRTGDIRPAGRPARTARPGHQPSRPDLSTLMTHLAIWGNGYLAKYRQQGEVAQLGLLHPERVRPELVAGQLRFRYTPGSGPQQMLTEADVVHVGGSRVDGVTGLSAVSQAARVLGLSDELVKHALSYFECDAAPRPAGVLRLGDRTCTERRRAGAKSKGLQGRDPAARACSSSAATSSTRSRAASRRRPVRRAAPAGRPGDRPGVPDPSATCSAPAVRRLA